ncbi:MAG: type I DNA topoisomerase [bacterium]|nr:type I DNA topoisomerase [bacterium]
MSEFKTLVIVESPGKIKTISKFLGADFIVKASVGHVVDLATDGKDNLGVDIENGFKPKYVVIPDKKDKIKAIVNAAKESNQIYLATDADREGEAIAWHLAEILKKTNLPIFRITFNEITKKAILRGINNPGPLNADLYDAQQARRVLDRIVGFSVSPFLIKLLGPKLSAGRVQSVAVRMVVDRDREIDAFVPEEYWTITADLAKSNKDDSFTAKYIERVIDEVTAKKIKTDLDSDTYNIFDIVEEEKTKHPFPPFMTLSLVTTAAGKYKFAAARTMKSAQSLYEAGMITYIRTDSVRLSEDSITDCRSWLKDNGYDLPSEPNSYVIKKDAQDAHEAIRPTDVTATPKNVFLSDDDQKIYTLIWERFVACQMKSAIYDNMSVTIKTSSAHILKANGRVLKYKGWLEITSDFDSDDSDIKLPLLKKNDNLILVPPKVTANQKFTKPPSRFTEKTLIEELKKKGIGRPSTYAAIMGKITYKAYVIKKANSFISTKCGQDVVDNLIKHFEFMNYDYTADMEEKLDQIADGKLAYIKMLTAFYTPFKTQLKKAYMSSHTDYGYTCNKCNEKMILKHGKFGFFLACLDYPKCKNTLNVEMANDKPIVKPGTVRDIEPVKGVQCPKCTSDMVKRDGKFGPFYSCIKYPACKGIRKVPFGKKCSACGYELYATLYNEESVLFCMNYPNCTHREAMPTGSVANPAKLIGDKVPKKINKMLK